MDKRIPYTLKTSARARNMRIVVHPDGEVVVSVPRFVPQILINKFVTKNSEWVLRHLARVQSRTVLHIQKKDIPTLKKQTLIFAENRCVYYVKRYGFTYQKITIRAQKSRWGSCSKSGNLSFNYKIAVLPEHMANYIAVHEICHLGEMNHSKKFWDLVKREIPEYLKIRKELRQTLIVVKA